MSASNASSGSQMSSESFRAALSKWAAGVTIVATVDDSGAAWGFTASSFSSLSLDPPLVLVCLDGAADCHPAFTSGSAFAVSILNADHGALALRFASKGEEKVAGDDLRTSAGGLPYVPDALAVLECDLEDQHPGGDHTILVGRVRACQTGPDAAPMVYYDRGFRRIADLG